MLFVEIRQNFDILYPKTRKNFSFLKIQFQPRNVHGNVLGMYDFLKSLEKISK